MVDYSIFTNEEEIPGEGIVLKRARAKVQSPGGVLSNTVKPEGSMLPNTRRTRLKQLQEQAASLEGTQPDFSQLQAFAKQQGEQGQTAMLNALAAQYAGESFQPLQTQFLKRAAAAQEPMKIGGGMLTPDGRFMRDPAAARAQELARLDRLIGAEQDDISAEERTAQARIDRLERDRQLIEQRQLDRELRRSLAETVRANRAAGVNRAPSGYQWVTGADGAPALAFIPGGPGDPSTKAPKETTGEERTSAGYLARMQAAEQILSGINNGEQTIFTKGVGAIPVIGDVSRRLVETEAQQRYRQAADDWIRAKLRKESGAVIGADEMENEYRTYFPQPGDMPQTIAQKAQARRQAEEQMKISSGRVIPTQAPASPNRALSPEEQAELQRLREKHRRGQ